MDSDGDVDVKGGVRLIIIDGLEERLGKEDRRRREGGRGPSDGHLDHGPMLKVTNISILMFLP